MRKSTVSSNYLYCNNPLETFFPKEYGSPTEDSQRNTNDPLSPEYEILNSVKQSITRQVYQRNIERRKISNSQSKNIFFKESNTKEKQQLFGFTAEDHELFRSMLNTAESNYNKMDSLLSGQLNIRSLLDERDQRNNKDILAIGESLIKISEIIKNNNKEAALLKLSEELASFREEHRDLALQITKIQSKNKNDQEKYCKNIIKEQKNQTEFIKKDILNMHKLVNTSEKTMKNEISKVQKGTLATELKIMKKINSSETKLLKSLKVSEDKIIQKLEYSELKILKELQLSEAKMLNMLKEYKTITKKQSVKKPDEKKVQSPVKKSLKTSRKRIKEIDSNESNEKQKKTNDKNIKTNSVSKEKQLPQLENITNQFHLDKYQKSKLPSPFKYSVVEPWLMSNYKVCDQGTIARNLLLEEHKRCDFRETGDNQSQNENSKNERSESNYDRQTYTDSSIISIRQALRLAKNIREM